MKRTLRILIVGLVVGLLLLPVAAFGQSEQADSVTGRLEAAPGISANGEVLTVAGSFTLDKATLDLYPKLKQIDFVSSTPSMLTVLTATPAIAFTFTGDWTLASDLTAASVRVLSGNFNTNSRRVTSEAFFIGAGYDSVEPLTVTLSNSIANTPWFTVYRGLSKLTLSTKGSTINTTHFFGGGQSYATVNLVGGGSYNLEDDNKITTLSADGLVSRTLYVRGTQTVKAAPTLRGSVKIVKAADAVDLPLYDQPKLSDPVYKRGSLVIGDVGLLTKLEGGVRTLGDWVYARLVSTASAHAGPAEAWWVGGTGNWSDDTNHWSVLGTGGAPGAGNLPGTGTAVHFDANSFSGAGQVVTVDVEAEIAGMDWTGAAFTPTLADDGVNIIGWYGGDLTFIAASNITYSKTFWVYGAAGPRNFTSNGRTLVCPIITDTGFTSTVTLQDALSTSGAVTHQRGTLDTNGKPLTCGTFTLGSASAKTLTLGASTVNCTGWNYSGSNLTLTANTATVKVTGTGAFAGGGLTYNAVELNGSAHTISGSNIFANLKLGPAGIQTLTFTDGTTQTVTAMTRTGTGMITLQGSGVGGWNIAKDGGGIVDLAGVSVSRSAASPAATWYVEPTSTNGGNNSGWTFAPTITAAAATDISTGQATVTGSVVHAGVTNPVVTVFYGTSDGVTVAGAWDSNTVPTSPAQPQGAAPFTAILPNLDYGTAYFYRVRAVNAEGTVWTAASGNFTTADYVGVRAFAVIVPLIILIGFLMGAGKLFAMGLRGLGEEKARHEGIILVGLAVALLGVGFLAFNTLLEMFGAI